MIVLLRGSGARTLTNPQHTKLEGNESSVEQCACVSYDGETRDSLGLTLHNIRRTLGRLSSPNLEVILQGGGNEKQMNWSCKGSWSSLRQSTVQIHNSLTTHPLNFWTVAGVLCGVCEYQCIPLSTYMREQGYGKPTLRTASLGPYTRSTSSAIRLIECH